MEASHLLDTHTQLTQQAQYCSDRTWLTLEQALRIYDLHMAPMVCHRCLKSHFIHTLKFRHAIGVPSELCGHLFSLIRARARYRGKVQGTGTGIAKARRGSAQLRGNRGYIDSK